MFLTFDTETTGLPKNFKADVSDSENWPRLVQLAWQLNDQTGKLISNKSIIVKPEYGPTAPGGYVNVYLFVDPSYVTVSDLICA